MSVNNVIALIAAYLLGAIPVGLLMVRVIRRKDITQWYSGRTGGTNVMRVAGVWAGLATAIADVLKAASAVWLARAITGEPWIEALAGALAIVGHNYSIFLLYRENGKFHLMRGYELLRTLAVEGRAGNRKTAKLDFFASDVWGSWGLSLDGSLFHTDGYKIVAPGQRGSVDQEADAEQARVVQAKDHNHHTGDL